MKNIAGLLLLCAGNLRAGTAGNSDVSYIYGAFMLLFVILLGIDQLRRYIRKKQAQKEALLPPEHDANTPE